MEHFIEVCRNVPGGFIAEVVERSTGRVIHRTPRVGTQDLAVGLARDWIIAQIRRIDRAMRGDPAGRAGGYACKPATGAADKAPNQEGER